MANVIGKLGWVGQKIDKGQRKVEKGLTKTLEGLTMIDKGVNCEDVQNNLLECNILNV